MTCVSIHLESGYLTSYNILARVILFIFQPPSPPPPPPDKEDCVRKYSPCSFFLDFDPSDWPVENTLNKTQKSPLPKLQLSVFFPIPTSHW